MAIIISVISDDTTAYIFHVFDYISFGIEFKMLNLEPLNMTKLCLVEKYFAFSF